MWISIINKMYNLWIPKKKKKKYKERFLKKSWREYLGGYAKYLHLN